MYHQKSMPKYDLLAQCFGHAKRCLKYLCVHITHHTRDKRCESAAATTTTPNDMKCVLFRAVHCITVRSRRQFNTIYKQNNRTTVQNVLCVACSVGFGATFLRTIKRVTSYRAKNTKFILYRRLIHIVLALCVQQTR